MLSTKMEVYLKPVKFEDFEEATVVLIRHRDYMSPSQKILFVEMIKTLQIISPGSCFLLPNNEKAIIDKIGGPERITNSTNIKLLNTADISCKSETMLPLLAQILLFLKNSFLDSTESMSYILQKLRGILIVGPSGVGKTYLVKQVVEFLDVNMIYISGCELMGRYYGESEARVIILRAYRPFHLLFSSGEFLIKSPFMKEPSLSSMKLMSYVLEETWYLTSYLVMVLFLGWILRKQIIKFSPFSY